MPCRPPCAPPPGTHCAATPGSAACGGACVRACVCVCPRVRACVCVCLGVRLTFIMTAGEVITHDGWRAPAILFSPPILIVVRRQPLAAAILALVPSLASALPLPHTPPLPHTHQRGECCHPLTHHRAMPRRLQARLRPETDTWRAAAASMRVRWKT